MKDQRLSVTGSVSSEHLRKFVEKIEHFENEKKNISDEIKEIYNEAKSAGFDVKILKHVIKLRKMDPAKLEEQEHILDLYRNALGV